MFVFGIYQCVCVLCMFVLSMGVLCMSIYQCVCVLYVCLCLHQPRRESSQSSICAAVEAGAGGGISFSFPANGALISFSLGVGSD